MATKTLSRLEVTLIVLLVLTICIVGGLIAVVFIVKDANSSAATTAKPTSSAPETSQTISNPIKTTSTTTTTTAKTTTATTTTTTTTATTTTATTTTSTKPTTPDPYPDAYLVGVGRADCTGLLADVPLMGYASSDQLAGGIHTRQYSRAFIVAEPDNSKRVVFVSADIGMVSQRVRLEVMNKLKSKYGDLYRQDNVILSGTHTHAGPAGYFQYTIFMLSSKGFIRPATDAIVNGIVTSIDRAHGTMKRGRIFLNKGMVEDSHINRSPTSYLLNPESERNKYPSNTDKDMTILKMTDMKNQEIGMFSWFAVHAVSMDNKNHLVSSDNMGYASYLFEQEKNKGFLPGEGSFVAAFASSNLGDVTPNIKGPHCINTGESCENPTSTCDIGGPSTCMATGPGKDVFESTEIIGEKIYLRAKDLYDTASEEVEGSVNSAHQWVDMSNVTVQLNDTHTVHTCKPALGYSFAAGTVDGVGVLNFTQGTLEGDPFWDAIRDAILGKPSNETVECQKPKPILINTGEMSVPLPWHPTIIDVQMITIGRLAVLAVPGEFTTMSGRRLREAVKKELDPLGTSNPDIVISGLSNVYTHYITTYEEYQAQRYEAASTIFGPHTLSAYIQQFRGLAKAIAENTVDKLPTGPHPPFFNESQLFNLLPEIRQDKAPGNTTFGDVLEDVMPVYHPGEIASVTFVTGNPRNSVAYMANKTYLAVEKYENLSGTWQIVHNDASWETRYYWHKGTGNQSNGTVEWHIPSSVQPGTYRIRLFGHYKQLLVPLVTPYEGISSDFHVTPSLRKNV